jgi:hypothetical protein
MCDAWLRHSMVVSRAPKEAHCFNNMFCSSFVHVSCLSSGSEMRKARVLRIQPSTVWTLAGVPSVMSFVLDRMFHWVIDSSGPMCGLLVRCIVRGVV